MKLTPILMRSVAKITFRRIMLDMFCVVLFAWKRKRRKEIWKIYQDNDIFALEYLQSTFKDLENDPIIPQYSVDLVTTYDLVTILQRPFFILLNRLLLCIKAIDLVTLFNLVTVFAETKSVTKSRLHCNNSEVKQINIIGILNFALQNSICELWASG